MASLTIEVPDDLARSLEGLAAKEHKSVQELALERLSSLVDSAATRPAGSPAAILQAMKEPPHLSAADIDELESAIHAGRIAVRTRELF